MSSPRTPGRPLQRRPRSVTPPRASAHVERAIRARSEVGIDVGELLEDEGLRSYAFRLRGAVRRGTLPRSPWPVTISRPGFPALREPARGWRRHSWLWRCSSTRSLTSAHLSLTRRCSPRPGAAWCAATLPRATASACGQGSAPQGVGVAGSCCAVSQPPSAARLLRRLTTRSTCSRPGT